MGIFFGVAIAASFIGLLVLTFPEDRPFVPDIAMFRNILRKMNIPVKDNEGLESLMKKITRTEAKAVVSTLRALGARMGFLLDFEILSAKSSSGKKDIINSHKAAEREFKEIDMRALEVIAKKLNRRNGVRGLSTNDLRIIKTFADALRIPLTALDELREEVESMKEDLNDEHDRFVAHEKELFDAKSEHLVQLTEIHIKGNLLSALERGWEMKSEKTDKGAKKPSGKKGKKK